jgi:hypothetical protein
MIRSLNLYQDDSQDFPPVADDDVTHEHLSYLSHMASLQQCHITVIGPFEGDDEAMPDVEPLVNQVKELRQGDNITIRLLRYDRELVWNCDDPNTLEGHLMTSRSTFRLEGTWKPNPCSESHERID